MTKQIIIERTIKIKNFLSEDKVQEISGFADFVSKRYEEYQMTHGIQQLASESKAFGYNSFFYHPTHFMAGAGGCFTYC